MPTGPLTFKKLNMTIVQACGVSSTSYNTSIRYKPATSSTLNTCDMHLKHVSHALNARSLCVILCVRTCGTNHTHVLYLQTVVPTLIY